jgi:hypothetical protein
MSAFEATSTEALWPSEAEHESATVRAEAGDFEAEVGAELESPFRAGATFGEAFAEAEGTAYPEAHETPASLESPFQSSFADVSESEGTAEAFHELLAELESEQFDEAVAQLVDEAAGLHLASEASWSSAEAAPGLAVGELEAWIEPLRQESHRMLDNMAERFGSEELETLRDSELETLFESLRPDTGFLPEAFENFLGRLFSKATSAVSKLAKQSVGAAWHLAKQGVSGIGGLLSLPVKFLLKKLAELADTLLRGVLQKAIGLLPSTVQPIARTLAARLVGEVEAEALVGPEPSLGRQFDIHAASLLLADTETEAESIVAEAEAEAEQPGSGALSELDDARARLAEQLVEVPAGQAPLAELEQFLPALLAARPAIRLGLKLIGRDKVVNFLADKIAGLIKGMVGSNAARLLSPPLVDVGLTALGLEAPAEMESGLGGEALASTIEETVNHVLELPAEAFADTLRMEAEVQEAFAEAAARNIPAEHLRPDLPQLEVAGARGVWVLMPRAARPRYRYKKYSRVFLVPITRQIARAIATADGGSVETMLLDHGVNTWPVNAEVHLYEALPNATHLGHIAQFEGEGTVPLSETLADLHPLTPDAAAMLVREPGLGRPLLPVAGPHHHRHVHHPAQVRHHPDFHHEPSPGYSMGHVPQVSAPDAAVVSSSTMTPVLRPPALQVSVAAARVDPLATHPATSPGNLMRPLPGGQRYFRMRLPGQVRPPSARPRRRIHVTDRLGANPSIRVDVRLSEQETQRLAEVLQRNSLPAALAWLKHRYRRVLPAVITAHLLRRGPVLLGAPVSQGGAARFAISLTEGVTQGLTAFLRDRRAELIAAVQSSAQGLTLTFTFHLAGAGAPGRGHVLVPKVGVRPGYYYGGHTALRRHAEFEGRDGEYGA